MSKTGYISPFFLTISVIFNQIANGELMPCPISAIKNYYEFANTVAKRKQVSPASRVIALRNVGKFSEEITKGKYLKKSIPSFLLLEGGCDLSIEEIEKLWRKEIAPHLTVEYLDSLIDYEALKILLGDKVEHSHKEICQFAKGNTQQLNPFIITLVLALETLSQNGKVVGRRSTIERYVQAIREKIGDEMETLTFYEQFKDYYFWDEGTRGWRLHDIYRRDNGIKKIWPVLVEKLREQNPEFIDATFDEAVLKKLLGEDTPQKKIDRVIQFVTENTPQKGHAKALLPQSTSNSTKS